MATKEKLFLPKEKLFRLKKGDEYIVELWGNCPMMGKRNAKRFSEYNADRLVKANPEFIKVKG